MMMEEAAGSSAEFHVKSSDPVLVPPCIPLPKSVLQLSPIDNLPGVRATIYSWLLVYDATPTLISANPAKTIREALAKVLVYYPALAGRLRRKENGEFQVECTGEGALFVEATADKNLSVIGDLEELNPALHQLLFSLPPDTDIEDLHLLVLQVTRFMCGGFVLGLSLHHSICDGRGASHFLKALAEMARGEVKPSLEPVWNRELVKPEDLLRLQFYHFDTLCPPPIVETIVQASHDITDQTIEYIKQRFVEEYKEFCSAFEVVAALTWIVRTKVVQIPHGENVKILFAMDIRRFFNPPLPKGYYGNLIGTVCAMDNVDDLLNGSLLRAIMIIKKSKVSLDENFRSGIVMNPSPSDVNMKFDNVVGFGDWRRLGYNEVDFGWGKPVNERPLQRMEQVLAMLNYFLFLEPHKSVLGGIRIRMFMPPSIVNSFKIEMEAMTNKYVAKA